MECMARVLVMDESEKSEIPVNRDLNFHEFCEGMIESSSPLTTIGPLLAILFVDHEKDRPGLS